MKLRILLILFITSTLVSPAQVSVKKAMKLLDIVSTESDAKEMVKDTTTKAEVYSLNQLTDTTDFHKYIFSKKLNEKGNYQDKFVFKILKEDSVLNLRASQIYLSGTKFSMEEIDTMRNEILNRLKEGTPFSTMALLYSMDGSQRNGGDLGWFEWGVMVEPFQQAVLNHKVGEVYLLDLPEYKWYFVVKTTHALIKSRKVTVIVFKI